MNFSSYQMECGVECLMNVTVAPVGTNRSEADTIWTADVIQRVATLVVIMVMTIVGNTLILIVLTCSKYRKLNRRVNIFIINLAIGDLTVCLVTMTTEILFVASGEWLFGAVGCKLFTYLQIVTLASTTFILTAMSFDRYLAICKPLLLGTSNSRARRMIIVSWILAFIFAIPQLFIFVQVEETKEGISSYFCKSRGYTAFWQRKLYFTFLTSYILVIPAFLISFFYINIVRVVWRQGRELSRCKNSSTMIRKCIIDKRAFPRARIKTIKMTLSIIISFIACWSPYFVTHLIRIYSEYKHEVPKMVLAAVETMALLQSALNPILYGCFNIKMKRGLLEVFCPRRLTRQNGTTMIYSNRSQVDCSFSDDGDRMLRRSDHVRKPGVCIRVKHSLNSCCPHYTKSRKNPNIALENLSITFEDQVLDNNSMYSNCNRSPNKRPRSGIITETNTVDGYKLRVRFLTSTDLRNAKDDKETLTGRLSTSDRCKSYSSTL